MVITLVCTENNVEMVRLFQKNDRTGETRSCQKIDVHSVFASVALKNTTQYLRHTQNYSECEDIRVNTIGKSVW